LNSLLSGQLGDRAGQRLATHLDTCETCQQRLTQLAAEPVWWLDASHCLEPATPGIDPCVDDLGDDGLDEFDAPYPNTEQDLLDCGLLTKSDNPAMIGALGRYDVKRVVGAGGTGIVLQAIDTELNRTVAIKVLAPILAAHGPARKRFARESKAVAAVAHENVVAVHHVEGGGRVPYLVMQYIDGDSLQDLVIREGPLDVNTTLRITAQLGAALAAAHDQGLVHRDVKPANILVSPVGERVWMTDFGLARAVDDASLTRTGFIAGTPHYMSPEQARGATVRSSSDLFGLGGVVYFMLTGRPPFRAERTLAILNRICTEPHRPVREVNSAVPPSVAKLVDRLLAKSADDRFADAQAVRTECLRLLANQTSPDGELLVMLDDESSVETPTRRPRTGRRVARWAVTIAFLAVCIALIVGQTGILERAARENVAMSNRSDGEQKEAAAEPSQPFIDLIFEKESKTGVTRISETAIGNVDRAQFVEPWVPSPPVTDRGTTSNPYGAPSTVAVDRNDPGPPNFYGQPFESNPVAGADNVESNDTGFAFPQPRDTTPSTENSSLPPIPQGPSIPSHDESAFRPVPVEGVFDESAAWQFDFDELEQALTVFETKVATADDQQTASDLVADHFDSTIRWMEATAFDLEHESPILLERVY